MTRFFHTQSFIVCLLLIVFSVSSRAAVPPAKPKTLAAQLVGTWQLISYNYVGLQQMLARDKVCIKTISSTHYSWVYYQATTKEMISSGGGSYSLTGNTCTEKVDFLQGMEADFRSAVYKTCYTTPDQMEGLYRANKCMQVDIQGDIMRITGTFINGYTMEEIWQRVK